MSPATQKRLFLENMRFARPQESKVKVNRSFKWMYRQAMAKVLLWAAWFSALTFVLCEMVERGIW